MICQLQLKGLHLSPGENHSVLFITYEVTIEIDKGNRNMVFPIMHWSNMHDLTQLLEVNTKLAIPYTDYFVLNVTSFNNWKWEILDKIYSKFKTDGIMICSTLYGIKWHCIVGHLLGNYMWNQNSWSLLAFCL